MNSSASSVADRFADYFIICGLDLSSGLEPDRFAGELLLLVVFDRLDFHIQRSLLHEWEKSLLMRNCPIVSMDEPVL